MKFLKRFSIQRQLMFVAGFVTIGMVGLAVMSHVTNNHVNELAEARLTLSQIDTSMLTLRRNEKDFMARKDPKYVDRFMKNFVAMQAKTDHLKTLLEHQDVESGQVDQLKEVFNSYHRSFLQVAATIEKIGLDPKSGLYGALRKAVHGAESMLKEQNQIQLTADMLMLRRREKDFMLRYDL